MVAPSRYMVVFNDGKRRVVEAVNFDVACVIAAYQRHIDAGATSKPELTVNRRECRKIGE